MAPVISARRIARGIAMQLRTSFVHCHRTAIQNRSVQRSNSRLTFSDLCHLHESEAARFAGVAVLDDCDGLNRTVRCEQTSQLLLGRVAIQVPHENVRHNLTLLLMLPEIPVYERCGKAEKAMSVEIAFCGIHPFRAPARFQLASPWDPWSLRIARSGLPAGS